MFFLCSVFCNSGKKSGDVEGIRSHLSILKRFWPATKSKNVIQSEPWMEGLFLTGSMIQ